MTTLIRVLEIASFVLSCWVGFLMLYQIVIGFYGFRRESKDYQDHEPRLRFLVLVPAHNEEAVISGIIGNLERMDYPRELYDYYIIADNCTDGTAQAARKLGARVLETRKDSPDAPTGKPIALQKALNMLPDYGEKYDLVMFFDADNLMDTSMFREFNSQFLSSGGKADVIQCYLGCKNNDGVVALSDYMSYTITNRFFNLAKHRMGVNAGIGGTGFAISAKYLAQRGGWTSMSLTEDYQTQLEMTCEGRRILWNNNVRVYDEKPTSLKACFRQRTRWAQGRWFVAFRNTRPVLCAALQGRISFAEFLSSFTGMYNMTPFLCLVAQSLMNLADGIIRHFTGLPVQVSIGGSWLPKVYAVIFFYSLFFLFYLGDHLDNHRLLPLRRLPGLIVASLINSYVSGLSHLVGLFKWRQQKLWVKTEHRILLPQEKKAADESNEKVRNEIIS